MNEVAACRVLLLRAYELRDDATDWSAADREWASRAAAEVEGEGASADAFIARRAALAVERLRERDRRIGRLLESLRWPAWVGGLVPALALLGGIAADALGPGRHVNLLAPPLLGLLAWNLVVYVVLAARGVRRLANSRASGPGPLAQALARLAHVTGPAPRRAGPVAAAFVRDWTLASARLTAARLSRVLHASAAAFALGAIGSMYLRGVALAYRAGWESTFLDAQQVHALLGFALTPASALTGIGLPDAAAIEAMRLPDGGAGAAPWLHLYAVTVALVVLLPRLLLFVGNNWIERRLSRSFVLPLGEPYYRSLLGILHATGTVVCIAPYGLELSAQATLNLNTLLRLVVGTQASVSAAPATPFGAEDDIDARSLAAGATLLLPLFAMTATPEAENHGAFIDRLRAAAAEETQLVVLVDAGAFRRRFDDAPRGEERRALWHRLAKDRRVQVAFVDLEQAEPGQEERRSLSAALEAAARR